VAQRQAFVAIALERPSFPEQIGFPSQIRQSECVLIDFFLWSQINRPDISKDCPLTAGRWAWCESVGGNGGHVGA
jgi:hypothetical protein